MTKEIEVFRLQMLSDKPENINWLKGWIFIKTEGGNIKAEIEHRHRLFWKKEFELTDEEIEKLFTLC
jgi:hypothetical protein